MGPGGSQKPAPLPWPSVPGAVVRELMVNLGGLQFGATLGIWSETLLLNCHSACWSLLCFCKVAALCSVTLV